MRLFTAIEFDNDIKAHITHTVSDLKKAGARGKFLSSETYHLTLNFVGDTERIDDIQKIFDSTLRFKPFNLELGGLGLFKRRMGDILWLGVKESPELSEIQRKLTRELTLADFDVETGKFKPHITLARKSQVKTELIKDASLNEASRISFTVKKISLVQSTLTEKGAVYDESYFVEAK